MTDTFMSTVLTLTEREGLHLVEQGICIGRERGCTCTYISQGITEEIPENNLSPRSFDQDRIFPAREMFTLQ